MYTVFYGTNRKPIDPRQPGKGYSSERDQVIHYGTCEVIIPESHEIGSVGSTGATRLYKVIRGIDDQLEVKRITRLESEQFLNVLRKELGQKKEKSALVYIHGFWNTFDDTALRAAQIGADLNLPGVMAFFSWPSKGSFLGYAADESTIEVSEDDIARFLVKIGREAGVKKINLVVHSMGNRGVLRALHNAAGRASIESGLRFGQIFLAAPDMDAEKFRQLASIYPTISERTTLYVSSKDKAVWASLLFHYFQDRVGYVPPITTLPGIDTIQVMDVDVDFLGHGYIASARPLLHDMWALLTANTPPRKRGLQVQPAAGGGEYWYLKQ